MPLYQYRCKKCGEITEKIQKFTDKPLTVCSFCNGAVEKIISAPGIIFKGSGFHITDYHRGKTHTDKEDIKHKAEDAKTKTETKSETPIQKETKKEKKEK